MVASGAVGYTSARSGATRRGVGMRRDLNTATYQVELENDQMESGSGFFDFLIQIIAAPALLLQFVIFSVLDLLAFDVLNLGPFLPIAF